MGAHGQIDFEAAAKLLRQKKKEHPGSGFSDVKFAKLANSSGAELKVRILPPLENERVPGLDVFKHPNVPYQQYDAIRGFPTCMKTWGQKCPVCGVLEEYRDQFDGSKWFSDFSLHSFYVNVIIRGSDKYPENVVHLLQCPSYTGVWLLESLLNDEIGDFLDPFSGADVILRREKMGGKITRTISRRTSPVHKDEKIMQEILNSLYDCRKIWKTPDEEYLKAIDNIAQDLQEIIEDRIVNLRKEDKGGRVREVHEAKQARKSSRNDRPECFGDFDEDARECSRCECSEDCEKRTK